MKPTISSARKYLIVVFLILVVFAITTGLFINFSKIPLLKSANMVVVVKSDFSKLDSCVLKLYNADNNCRMYVVTGDITYYKKFVEEIKEISKIIDTIEQKNKSERAISSETFNALLQQKKLRTAQFIHLKHLSDSLINFSSEIKDEVKDAGTLVKPKLFSSRQFRSMVKIDTIKPVDTVRRKKLFERILAAFKSNKKKKSSNTSKHTLVETTISNDTSSLNVAYNKMQLRAINDYYLQIYKANRQLRRAERDLLDINHRLIITIVNGLKEYRERENKYYSSVQDLANVTAFKSVENLDRFTFFLLVFAGGLLIFIFFTIYHFYKNEKALVDFSNKAASYALSKSRFLANMSHEIRTPLNSIVGFSEQLTKANLKKEQYEQVIAIRNSSVMLLDVVNDILDFSKYETGKVTLEQVPFSPYFAIKDVFESLKLQAYKKKLTYELDLLIDENIFILGDPLRLKQVIMNLLSNAIKFTNNGSVKLKARLIKTNANNAMLEVYIQDTGFGISSNDQKIIFDEFAQVYYASNKNKHQGTGLGLAICKKIVEFQGGKIEVKSEENKGSVFSFELPFKIVEQAEEEKSSHYNHVADLSVFKGKKVLLADDNLLNILLASTILKKYKIDFDAVYNGNEALELFNENRYDVVLTDIQMPEMGGIELTHKIRNADDHQKRTVPILGVTANVMQEDREKYLASGMNELVLKPFLEQELIEKIAKFL